MEGAEHRTIESILCIGIRAPEQVRINQNWGLGRGGNTEWFELFSSGAIVSTYSAPSLLHYTFMGMGPILA